MQNMDAIHRALLVLEARNRLTLFAIDHGLAEVLVAILDEAEHLTASQAAFCRFLEEDQRTLTLSAWSTRTNELLCSMPERRPHLPLEGAGLWADCVRKGEPLVCNDYAALSRTEGLPDGKLGLPSGKHGLPDGHLELSRLLCVPICRGEKIVAVIGVGNREEAYGQAEVDILTDLADFAWDVAGRKRAEELAAASDERFTQLASSIDSVFWLYELSSKRVVYASPAFPAIWGKEAAAVLSRREDFLATVHEADRGLASAFLDGFEKGVHSCEVEFRIRRAEDDIRWIRIRSFPVRRGAAGSGLRPSGAGAENAGTCPNRIAGLAEDVTERKLERFALERAYDEINGFYHELQHRIQNSFTLIMSLFSLDSANSCGGSACQDHLERLSNRVASISGLYSMLGTSRRDRSIELKPYLSGIVSAIETGFLQDRRGIGISGVFEDVVVDAEKAAAIALIANELVTNSIKYAFVGRSEGMVRIELKRDQGELKLVVSDDGVGLPEDFSPEGNPGLGLRLASLLAEQHKGRLSWQGEGRRSVELSLPV